MNVDHNGTFMYAKSRSEPIIIQVSAIISPSRTDANSIISPAPNLTLTLSLTLTVSLTVIRT